MVDEAIRKARVLVEALGWIRQFRGRYVVIKLGGSTLENSDLVKSFLQDVLFLESVGMRPILIHGGGKDISRAMEEAGIEPKWVNGRRYTDQATLEIASRVLADEICQRLVDELNRQEEDALGQGGEAIGLSFRTTNCLFGERLTLQTEDGEVDLGRVGKVVDIARDVLEEETSKRRIPVLPCIAVDSEGGLLNVNGDTAAASVARLLKAEKLVFVSDVPGIMRDPNDPSTLISHITVSQARDLIADGTIASGMVPKVEAALEAIEAGVGKLHIVDGRIAHSLLLEVYSDQGIGTEIVA